MKKTLLFAAFGLLALASCTTSDEFFDPEQEQAQQELNDNVIRFSTYMGKQAQTRAGYEKIMTTDRLKNQGGETSGGFGVFGYYTGTVDYKGSADANNTASTNQAADYSKANFMFNQQVTWNNTYGSDGHITGWTYSPMKFWPNEVSANDNDDQENDQNDKVSYSGADGTSANGGEVSFFAYAPYVTMDQIAAATSDGIIAINGETTLAGANAYASGDPTITYKLAADGQNVDLLWGTKGNTSKNVNDQDVTYDYVRINSSNNGLAPVNVNLTKQRTSGVVDFNFKHVTSRVGGSSITIPGFPNKNGLMVVLDIDDQKGQETGGSIIEGGSHIQTKVTIKSIVISNDLDASGSLNPSMLGEYNNYVGVLNLATGKWDLSTTEPGGSTNLIQQKIGSVSSDGATTELNSQLSEWTISSKDNDWFNKSHTNHTNNVGVTTTAENVYNAEVSPLVFFPETAPKLRFTIDYIVRTRDTNLSDGYSEVEQVISKKVQMPTLERGKAYNVLIHLGLTSVKFTASVSDWDIESTGLVNPTSGEFELESEDVYLPRNVSGLLATYATTTKGSVAGNIAISGTKYFIDDKEQNVNPAQLKFYSTESWATYTQGTPQIDLAANTTYTDRTTTVYFTTLDEKIFSEKQEITQYGRVPTSAETTLKSGSMNFTSAANTFYRSTTFNNWTVHYFEKQDNGTNGTTGTASAVNTTAIKCYDQVTGEEATWITVGASDGVTISANTTGIERKADIYLIIEGKRIKTNQTITQEG